MHFEASIAHAIVIMICIRKLFDEHIEINN